MEYCPEEARKSVDDIEAITDLVDKILLLSPPQSMVMSTMEMVMAVSTI